MANSIEWAHASQGFALLSPEEVEALSPDGNDAGDHGLLFGDESVMLYGPPNELFRLLSHALSDLAVLTTAEEV
jgi:hypothetical protein